MTTFNPAAPVMELAPDAGAAPQPGIALCLSGGGYRAMLFHLGALWRLNDAGYLPRLDRVSSVSGGSITAGVLGLAWKQLAFDQQGIAQAFQQRVAAPIYRLASTTVDVWVILSGLLGPRRVSDYVARAYRKHLFGEHTLQDLPGGDGPRFVINASNLQSGVLWRFSRPYARDYRVGEIPDPTIDLAVAVAASSAFPPFLSPLELRLPASAYKPNTGKDLQFSPYTTRVLLTDGGVYDNLGLETAWKRYQTILVSDGGGLMQPQPRPWSWWPVQAYRVLNLIDSQVRSLRKRQLISSYLLPPGDPDHREGAYWGIGTNIADYRLPNALDCPFDKTKRLAGISTRLGKLSTTQQQQLVNWGFAVCDAALRKHVDPAIAPPTGFPYPQVGVG